MSDCGAVIQEASSANYIFISKSLESMLGYKSEVYTERGLDFILSIAHPDERGGLILILHKELDYLLHIHKDECLRYCSSYDYRLKKANNEYVRVLQRNQICEFAGQGMMMYMLSIITDVTHLKGNQNMMLHIKPSDNIRHTYVYDLSDHKLMETHFPSKRELQLLKLLGKGHSSKEIAAILSISVHTVETHRRNMLEKANVKDTSTLICYALAIGFL